MWQNIKTLSRMIEILKVAPLDYAQQNTERLVEIHRMREGFSLLKGNTGNQCGLKLQKTHAEN